jgi:hypothetical protein
MPSPDFEKLELLIHDQLSALPGRTAPRALESRVLAELSRRAALPWWRRSYTHWPVGLRYAFILLLAGAAAACLGLSRSPVTAQALSALALRFPWIAFLQSVAANLWETGGVIFDAIPTVWLYGGIAALACAYGLLLGVGAAAYRALGRPHPRFVPLSS